MEAGIQLDESSEGLEGNEISQVEQLLLTLLVFPIMWFYGLQVAKIVKYRTLAKALLLKRNVSVNAVIDGVRENSMKYNPLSTIAVDASLTCFWIVVSTLYNALTNPTLFNKDIVMVVTIVAGLGIFISPTLEKPSNLIGSAIILSLIIYFVPLALNVESCQIGSYEIPVIWIMFIHIGLWILARILWSVIRS